jgi:hypothetical protein
MPLKSGRKLIEPSFARSIQRLSAAFGKKLFGGKLHYDSGVCGYGVPIESPHHATADQPPGEYNDCVDF